jgi:transposase-like protein
MDKRKFSPEEKLAVVLEALETGKITDTCKKHGIPPQLVYDWKAQLKRSGGEVYKRKKTLKNDEEEQLKEENARLKEVIAEITSENLKLKKTLGR